MERAVDDVDVDVGRWLRSLSRRRAMIATIVVTTVTAALLLSLLQTKQYEASAEIQLEPNGDVILLPDAPAPRDDPAQSIQTAIQVLRSQPVRAAVQERLGPVPRVLASRVADTFIIQVRARGTDRFRAARVATAYAQAYIELRRRQVTKDLLAAVKPLEKEIADLQLQIDQLSARLSETPPAQRDALAASTAARRDSLIEQQARFNQRTGELEVQASLIAESGRMVEASPPTSPVSPTPVRNAILALILGLLSALSAALLLEYLDQSIRTIDDIPPAAAFLPVLGVIPQAAGRRPDGNGLLSLLGHDDAVGESYRALRTAILHLGIERQLTTIQVTSPAAGDGKSTTVANLGVVMAAAGQRVVLVDCDLRRRKLHSLFDMSSAVGLSSVLAGASELADALQPVAVEPGLFVLPAGPAPADPSEILGSRRMSEILFSLQSQFDVVLVDSPPALAVTDAIVVSSWVEATLIVVDAKSTSARQLRSVLRLLRQSDAPLAGLILNRADLRANYGYGYGYGYGPASRKADGDGGGGSDAHVAPVAPRKETRVNGTSLEQTVSPWRNLPVEPLAEPLAEPPPPPQPTTR